MSKKKERTSKIFRAISVTIGTLAALATVLAFLFTSYDKWFARGDTQLLRVAQDLRYNRVFLEDLIVSGRKNAPSPAKTIRTDALMTLVTERYDILTEHAYGEEKYIYQHVLRYDDLATRLNESESRDILLDKIENMECTLHDVYFLNQFLIFYLEPILDEEMSENQKYTLGWNFSPGKQFKLPMSKKKKMQCFTVNGREPKDFVEYLSVLD